MAYPIPGADGGQWGDYWSQPSAALAKDRERWCQGPCMDAGRRVAARFDADMELWREDMAEWDKSRRGRVPPAPEPPRVDIVRGDPVFDGLCRANIRQALVELDDLASIYAAAADGHRGATDEPYVSGSTTPRSPSPTAEDLDELDGWLRSWRATQMGSDTWARTGMIAQSITTQVAWIKARLDVMLARGFAKDFGLETLAWHRRIARASKADITVERLPLRCPGCRRLTLERRHGADLATCRMRDCRHVMTRDEYDASVERAAGTAVVDYGPPLPTVPHVVLLPSRGDDVESRAAGPRGASEGIRIDRSTYRLMFDAPYNRPLLEEEWASLPWPSCPSCGGSIVVRGQLVEQEAKPAAMVGSSVLPALPAERHVVPRYWECSKGCGAGG